MFLSQRVWLTIVTLLMGIALGVAPAAHAEASSAAASAPKGPVDYDWVDALERRIERLLPSLLGSLAAVRKEREPALVRCFDRAVSALNSVSRQVSYHADHLEDEAPSERERHQKALLLLNTRVDDIATARIGCFTDGAVSVSGQTRVEVVYVSR